MPVPLHSLPSLPEDTASTPAMLRSALHRPEPGHAQEQTHSGLVATPLPRVLAQMLSMRRTGSLTLQVGERGEKHVVDLVDGAPVAVRTTLAGRSLRELVVGCGILDSEGLAAAETRALRNQVLLTQQLEADGVLVGETLKRFHDERLLDKLRALATLPDGVRYSVTDPKTKDAPGEALPGGVDPLSAILATARVCGCRAQVDALLASLGDHRVQLHWAATPERFGPNDLERSVLASLRARPRSYPELLETADEGPDVVRPLAYALLVTQHLETGEGGFPLSVDRNARPPRPATHYEALGIERDATPLDVQAAFARALREVTVSGPEASEPFAFAAVARRVLGDPRRRAAYDESLRSGPTSDQMALEKDDRKRTIAALDDLHCAERLLAQSDLQAAEAAAARAVLGAPDPEHLALFANIVGLSGDEADAELALSILGVAAAAAPNSARAFVLRARVLARIGRQEDALRDFRAAAAIDPNDLEVLGALRASAVPVVAPKALARTATANVPKVKEASAAPAKPALSATMRRLVLAGAAVAALALAAFATFHRSDEARVREYLVTSALAAFASDLPQEMQAEVVANAKESQQRLTAMGPRGARLVAAMLDDATVASVDGTSLGVPTRQLANAWLLEWAALRQAEPPPSAVSLGRALDARGSPAQPQWDAARNDWQEWIAKHQ